MCDDEGRSVIHQNAQRLEQGVFGFGIECAGRFVEDEDRSVFQQRARDGETLTFAAGKCCAAFAYDSLVAEREFLDEQIRVGGFGGSSICWRVASGEL